MTEELAIIKGVGFGLRDAGYPVLSFETKQEGSGALQVLNLEQTGKLIQEAEVYDIKDLEGKACIVEKDGMMMKFKRMAKI